MELPDLGKQCKVCNTLDFLPFECPACHLIFCRDHRSRIAHSCTAKHVDNIVEEPTKTTESVLRKCQYCSTKAPDVETLSCVKCNGAFCLSHRFPEQHECKVLKQEMEERESSRKVDTAKQQPAKEPTKAPEIRGAKNAALAKQVALMKMKQKAKGLNSIPFGERVFFNVWVNDQKEGKPFYLCHEWSVGKSVDWLAYQLGLNHTNQQNVERLVLTKKPDNSEQIVEEIDPFDYSHKLKDLIREKRLENGDSIWLKYIQR